MSNVDKLKKKAAEFEQKKQFDKALEVYLQIIEQTEDTTTGMLPSITGLATSTCA